MPGVPSNNACERCKKKHLKCDETRPHCQRCATAGADCPGYVQTRKFIDQGATVRRRYAPYQESHAKPGATNDPAKDTDQAPPSRANTEIAGAHSQPPRHSPSQESDDHAFHLQMADTSLESSNDSQMEETIPSEPFTAAAQMQFPILQPSGSQSLPQIDPLAGFRENSRSTQSTDNNSVSPIASVGLHPTLENAGLGDQLGYNRSTSTKSMPQSEKEDFQDIFSELMTGTEHEIAFLTRHYVDVIGPWLDLSDTGKFFSVYVPIRAINNPALKYAIAALAAKQLARVKGGKSSTDNGIITNPASTEIYPNATEVDWFLKAANYYYLAVSDLNSTNSNGYTALSTSAVLESPIETINRWLSTHSMKSMNQSTSGDGSLLREAEDMLAAVVLLTFYRLLDSKGEDWQVHLSGVRTLFNYLIQTTQAGATRFTHAIRASFWNFARQDYLGSYFTRTPTHLDPANLALWCAAGISIDDQLKFHIVRDGPLQLSQEDQAANGLSWLISKVINFLAHSKQSQIAQWTGSPPDNMSESQTASTDAGIRLYPDTNTWLDLCFDLQTWFEGVPETFRPCVRIERPRGFSEPSGPPQSAFPEVFYSQATCAFAMQHYHFGRIALLLNRPADIVSAPSTAFDRLQGYREVTKEVEYRSRELCGIALGRPRGEVRIYMVPLLFAVGQCLESAKEHQVIVDLLRGLEADWGWATEYAIQKLQASWSR